MPRAIYFTSLNHNVLLRTDVRRSGFVVIIFHWTQNWTVLNFAVNFEPLIRPYWPRHVYSPIKGIEFHYFPQNQNVRGRKALIRGHFTIYSTCATYCAVLDATFIIVCVSSPWPFKTSWHNSQTLLLQWKYPARLNTQQQPILVLFWDAHLKNLWDKGSLLFVRHLQGRVEWGSLRSL